MRELEPSMPSMPPNLPIVDAHVHLWEVPHFPRPWLAEAPALKRTFGLAHYQEQTRGVPVAAMVYVETAVAAPYMLLEAQWAVALAQAEPRLRGVVAAAPVDDGIGARAYLAALAALGPLVKGVRRNLQDERDPEICLRPDFVAGVRLLAEYGFSFDICIRYHQLPAVTELVRACPAVSFVLDHLGKPPVRAGLLEPWRDQLTALAALPNVACKISGLVTEADVERWRPGDLAPYVAHALAVFGPSRVLFGSDWPVATLAASYTRWVEALDGLTASMPADQRRQLWGENARRWYRLDSGT
jgi:L-fuconolactonase